MLPIIITMLVIAISSIVIITTSCVVAYRMKYWFRVAPFHYLASFRFSSFTEPSIRLPTATVITNNKNIPAITFKILVQQSCYRQRRYGEGCFKSRSTPRSINTY